MTPQEAKDYIAQRNRLGRKAVDALKEQGSWDGIERVVTAELYPDKSHFLFELLQNAEDAGASELHFSLSLDRLSAWHDGRRLFTKKDAEAITSIGQSPKRDDVNQIGKFGVGFKSVFAYTLSPRISSGFFHFEIWDLICPEWVAPQEKLNPQFTYFRFPFNRPTKPRRECFMEVAAALDRLPHSTLLFLRNVKEITWKVAGKSDGFLKNESPKHVDSDVATIHARQRDSSGKTKTTHWLKFEAPLRTNAQLSCSTAFLLTPPPKNDGDLESDTPRRSKSLNRPFVITPLSEPGHLHIYFPAGKEPTGLFFHIHAPFAATVDRASIPFDHDGNRALITDLASLCAKCLHEIKQQGLLFPQFLGVLPNERDKLDEFYEPIREAIVGEFKEQPLLPTHHGRFAKAKDVVFGPRELRQFFSDEDLQFLMAESNKVWSPGFRNSSRPDLFLDTLEVTAIDWEEFAAYIGGKLRPDSVSPQQIAASQRWLRNKMSSSKDAIDWLRTFYLLLLKADKGIRPHQWAQPDENLRKASVVWTSGDAFLPGGNVFFGTGSIAVPGVTIQTIHADLLEKRQTDKAKELRVALEMLGVQEYDEEAAIAALVQQISSQKRISRDEHVAQLKCVLEWHRAGKIHDFKLLSSTHLFLDADAKHYRKPEVFFLDSPIERTGIAPFFAGLSNRYELWPGYLDHFEKDVFSSFAKKVGVAASIPVRETTISWSHPDSSALRRDYGARHTHYRINEDWVIDGLDEVLSRREPDVNKVLWNALCRIDQEVLIARYRPNAEADIQTAPSSLVYALRGAEWVLGSDGVFRRPENVTAKSIAPGWLTDDSNGWMEIVAFGCAARAVEAEVVARREAAETIGLAPELAEELRSLSAGQQNELLDRIRASKRRENDFPQDEGSNSDLRAKRAEEQAKRARSVERDVRSRTVRTSSNRPEVREYLSQKYTRDGRLFCQMSQEEMPFLLPSNEPYFEAVEILPLGKELVANHLCLSPTCAAEFQHALQTGEDALRARILNVDPEVDHALECEVEVPLTAHQKIRFVRSHLKDLQAALRACGQ